MDRTTIGRVGASQNADRILKVAGQLEELAVQFPRSREKVIAIMEDMHGQSHKHSTELKKAEDRIAALAMLEILSGKQHDA